MSFFEELKRRNVVRVGIAYIVAAWLIVQVGDIARESFEAPAWVMKMVITALIAGLPIVLFFSWAYEITPEGIKKEKDIVRDDSISSVTGKKLDAITITLLIGAIVLIGLDRFVFERPAPAQPAAVTIEAPIEAESRNTSDVSVNSIAVLPFVNMSNDPDQDYFSDGISEELLNLLVKVDGLDVASRTSAFAYKGSNVSIPQIASELKVANVLEGSVRKAGNQVRITAQLIDTTNDRHLWSDSYDRDLDDIFQVQDEIATAIVAALKAELGLALDEEAVSVVADTGDMDAYDLYLRGRELILTRTTLNVAVELLQRAVELDPEFTRAWAAMATAAYLTPSWNQIPEEGVPEILALANRANERALELDPNQADAWALKSMLELHDEGGPDYAAAISYLDRSLEIDPNNPTAWLWRGIKYSEAGFHEQGAEDMQKCLDIEPNYQNCQRHLSFVLWVLGRKEESMDMYTQGARSGFTANDTVFVPILIKDGQVLAGILAGHYINAGYPGFPMEAWIDALEHPERDNRRYLPLAIEWLDKTEQRPIGVREMLMLAFRGYDLMELDQFYVNNWIWHPAHPNLRKSPHFQRLIDEMNLPEFWEEYGMPSYCTKTAEDYICGEYPASALETADRTLRKGDGT